MVKFGFILVLLFCWFFATMLRVNEKSNNLAAFIWKSLFFWAAIAISYSLGQMS